MHATRLSIRRGGFTLLELLVVMAIILTLAGLLMAAIFKAMSMAEKLAQVSDVKGLHEAVAAFKAHFDIEYMPSQIRLYSIPPAQDDEYGSVTYMRRLFPSPGFVAKWQQGMNWGPNPDGLLQGHECLVFFLGGPQGPGNDGKPRPMGWSNNPANPCDESGARRSFYDFPIERLQPHGSSSWASFFPKSSTLFPYAYFSKKTSMNSYSVGDCSNLGGPNGYLQPYGNDRLGFMNPDSYQIIGPGVNLRFGMGGGSWTPQRPYPFGDDGYDDVANFYGTATLGSSQ